MSDSDSNSNVDAQTCFACKRLFDLNREASVHFPSVDRTFCSMCYIFSAEIFGSETINVLEKHTDFPLRVSVEIGDPHADPNDDDDSSDSDEFDEEDLEFFVANDRN